MCMQAITIQNMTKDLSSKHQGVNTKSAKGVINATRSEGPTIDKALQDHQMLNKAAKNMQQEARLYIGKRKTGGKASPHLLKLISLP